MFHTSPSVQQINSEFCYAPLGGHGGDPDRYVAGALFGCIPVMLNTSGGIRSELHKVVVGSGSQGMVFFEAFRRCYVSP